MHALAENAMNHTLTMSNEIRGEKHKNRYRTIGLIATAEVALVIMTVLAVSFCMGALSPQPNGDSGPSYAPGFHCESVVSGSIALNPTGEYFMVFSVPKGASNATLTGNFTATGNSTNNDVIITVLSQKNFDNWLNGRNCNFDYNPYLMPMLSGNINVTLPNGIYFITMSSASQQPKTVMAQIDLTFST